MTGSYSAPATLAFRSVIRGACLLAGLTLAGCGGLPQLRQSFTPSGELTAQQRTEITENRLKAAGFKAISPATPEEMRHYQKLPPMQITYRIGAKGELTYYFNDPTYCHCYFSGNDEAYQRYQGQKIEVKQTRQGRRSDELNDAQMQMQQMQLMGPFGIDSPLGGNGPGTNLYSY
jgi:hypothetical protein